MDPSWLHLKTTWFIYFCFGAIGNCDQDLPWALCSEITPGCARDQIGSTRYKASAFTAVLSLWPSLLQVNKELLPGPHNCSLGIKPERTEHRTSNSNLYPQTHSNGSSGLTGGNKPNIYLQELNEMCSSMKER